MKTRHDRAFCAALLAVILLMTAAGCAAEKPADRAPEQVSAERSAGPVRLSGSGSLTESAEGGDEGKTETGDTGPTGTGGAGATAPDEGGITDIGGDTSGIGDGDITGIGGDTVGTAGDDRTGPDDGDKTGPDDDGAAETDDGGTTETGEEEPADAELIYDAGTRIELVKGKAIREGEEPVLTVALTGLEFAGSLDADGFEWDGLPDGLEFTVERIDAATAEITLSGTPAGTAQEVRLSLTIGGDQFQPRRDQDLPVTGSVEITFTAGPGLSVSPVILAVCVAAAAVVLAAVIAAAVIVSRKKKGSRRQQGIPAAEISRTEDIRREPERRDMANHQHTVPGAQTGGQKSSGAVQIGKLHNIGRRSAQQDSMGSMSLADGSGVFAVVADGMGGLSGGDQVSQGVVMSMLQQAGSLGPGQMDGVLSAMVRGANEEINRQLGPDGIYRSGSTVVAVLVRGGAFHWISVGDSRIYLYRGGSMLQLNQEHTYEVELMQRVMNGEMTAAEAAGDPQRRGLTSFIGMGRLKYVDASRRPVLLQSGDRILLMTDGVFNNLPETAMADTLRRNPDVQQAAKILEEQVLALQDPAQDNFTAVILGFQG